MRVSSGAVLILAASGCREPVELLDPELAPPGRPGDVSEPASATPDAEVQPALPQLCGGVGASTLCTEQTNVCLLPPRGRTLLQMDCFEGILSETEQTPPQVRNPVAGPICSAPDISVSCCAGVWPCDADAGGPQEPTLICPLTCFRANESTVSDVPGCLVSPSNQLWRPGLGGRCFSNFICDEHGRSLVGRRLTEAKYFFWCGDGRLQRGTLAYLQI